MWKWRNIWPDLLGVATAAPFVFHMNGLWLGLGCLVITLILLAGVHWIVRKCT